MKHSSFSDSEDGLEASVSQNVTRWHTFSELLLQLHREGIYIHPHQLAEFLLKFIQALCSWNVAVAAGKFH